MCMHVRAFKMSILHRTLVCLPELTLGASKITLPCTSSSKGSNCLVPHPCHMAYPHSPFFSLSLCLSVSPSLPLSHLQTCTLTEIKVVISKEDIIWNICNPLAFSTQSPKFFSHHILIKCKVLCFLGSFQYLFTWRNTSFSLLYTGGYSE